MLDMIDDCPSPSESPDVVMPAKPAVWRATVTKIKHAEGVEEVLVQRSLPFPSRKEGFMLFTSAGLIIGLILQLLPMSILSNILAAVMLFWSIQLVRSVKEESLLLCTDLGIQLTRRPFFGSEQSVFVEHHKVEDVILNEGITFASVQTYLAFMIQGSENMLVAFNDLDVALDDLISIRQCVRSVMFDENT